jgi:hypothetical protein
MNTLRTDFGELKDRKISITPYWVLGFVEGEGSFTSLRTQREILHWHLL